jgi:hypothetical protein
MPAASVSKDDPFAHLPEEFHSQSVSLSEVKFIPTRFKAVPVRGFLPKTDCGYWMHPSSICSSDRMKGVPGFDIIPPTEGSMGVWCNLKVGPSATYPLPLDWTSMNWNRSSMVVPALLERLKRLWTPPSERIQRQAECIAAFSIAKEKKGD